MPDTDSSWIKKGHYAIHDPEQARLLTDPVSKEFFKPFVAQEASASQAAAEVGCKLNTMLYRIGTFLEAGLLVITREEKRVGRSIKYYRSVADAFFIPFELTPYAGLEERLMVQLMPTWRQLARGLANIYQEHGLEGQRLYRDEHGVVWTSAMDNLLQRHLLNDAMEDDAYYLDVGLQLNDGDVKKLVMTLKQLFAGLYEQEDPRGKPYLLQMVVVPRDRND